MALTFSPTTTMRLNTRRSRSREHTGRSRSMSRSRSRSRESEMARFAAGGRTRRRNTHISSSDDVQDRGGYSDTMSHSSESDSGRESRRRRRRFSLSNSPDGIEQRPVSPSYGDYDGIGNLTQSETAVVLSKPDVLDCPICLDPLSPPVYQCGDGHLACGSCSGNNESTCPSCRMPIVYRCRSIEKVLESAKTPCRNREHGCLVTISYSQKFTHEKSCKYNVCSCPYYGCDYVDTSNLLYRHFSIRHSLSVRNFQINASNRICLDKDINQVFLQERHGSTLFVFNRKIEPLGSLFSVVLVAPTTSHAKYTYKLTACTEDRSICLRSYVDVTPKFSTWSPKQNCFLITNDFADQYGSFELELRIRNLP